MKRQEEPTRRDPSPRTDIHAIDVAGLPEFFLLNCFALYVQTQFFFFFFWFFKLKVMIIKSKVANLYLNWQ